MTAALPGHVRHTAGVTTTTTAIAGKALRDFVRTPQLIATTLAQGFLFLLVFRYVFGGAIRTGPLQYIDFMLPGIVTAVVDEGRHGMSSGRSTRHPRCVTGCARRSRPGQTRCQLVDDAVDADAVRPETALPAGGVPP